MLLSHIRLFVTPWTVAYHAPPSMEFAKQEYWSTLPFLLQRIFPTQGSNLALLHCRQMFYHLSHQGRYKPKVKEGLKPIIENLKKQGLLSPCNTPCNTPILSVKKSNGKWRLVQDLQIINEAVVPFTHMPKTNGFSCLQVYVRNFLYPFLYFNKTLLYKTLEWSSLVPGPEVKSSSEIRNPTLFTVSCH